MATLVVLAAAALRCGSDFRQGGVPIAGGSAGESGAGKGGHSSSAGGDEQTGGDAHGGEPATSAGGDGGEVVTSGGGGAAGGEGGAPNQGGAGGDGSTGTPVSGKVVHEFGGALVGWQVAIGDVTVTTNSEGEFTIPGVGASYDLIVAASNEHIIAYQGLTTRTPTVVVSLEEGDSGWGENTVSLSGSISNRLSVIPVSLELWLGGRSVMEHLLGTLDPPPATLDYERDFTWGFAQSPVDATFFAIQHDNGNWRVDEFSLETSADGAYAVNLVLGNVASRAVTVTPSLAPGVSLDTVSRCLSRGCGTTLPVGMNDWNARVEVTGTHASGMTVSMARLADSEDDVTVALTAPPVMLSPANAAVGVAPTDEFSWEPYADGVHLLKIGADGFLLEVYTAQTTFALSEIGNVSFSTAPHGWQVIGVGPGGVDDLVTGNTLLQDKGVEYRATGPIRTFTP